MLALLIPFWSALDNKFPQQFDEVLIALCSHQHAAAQKKDVAELQLLLSSTGTYFTTSLFRFFIPHNIALSATGGVLKLSALNFYSAFKSSTNTLLSSNASTLLAWQIYANI
jgi:hypothetical protein